MSMAAVATSLLLATSSFSYAEAVGESFEDQKVQLRGASRSMAALVPTSSSSVDDRFTDDRKSVRLPVSPGIADSVDATELPCMVQTICEQPELSILCGFITSNLWEWNSTKGTDNFLLGESAGTFLAPIDEAFEDYGTLLSRILTSDMANPSIVENVLLYHMIQSDEFSNTTELFPSVGDFECNGKLLMANGQTTTTVCFDDFSKHQLGFGNMNMRNAPKVIEKGIETCDGSVVMHFVDELILPPLPLAGIPVPATPSFIETSVCPIEKPELNGACRDTGGSCGYSYSYDGCTWNDLQCVPTLVCTCSDIGTDGIGGWRCSLDLTKALKTCPEPDVVVSTPRSSVNSSVVEKPPQKPAFDSRGLPKGRCDPNEPLPTPSDECPAQKSDSCGGYTAGKVCEFGHMYQGCTWEELECTVVEECTCLQDGSWECMASAAQLCGSFDFDLGWVEDKLPEGLPWGRTCNPNEPLPRPPLFQNDTVVSRISDECPFMYSFDSCEGFESNLRCDYNFEYDGCTWETLECSPIMECECNLFGDGNWACRSEARLFCSDKPEGFPMGRCDPNTPLPRPPVNTVVTAEVSSVVTRDTGPVKVSLTSSSEESDEKKDEDTAVSLLSGGMP